SVRLNPERHTAANAYAHSLAVAARAAHLARRNGLDEPRQRALIDLAYLHDIGKVGGTANPSASVELLPRYGVADPELVELVRMHDINLPWHLSMLRGEAPSDKAWRKLARRVDLYLLCLFMVADRVDCPGGWRANSALVWFLDEVDRRGLLERPLEVDDA
ncbi:MAG: HD domain-containing protein, partial [Polyangia bacterium]